MTVPAAAAPPTRTVVLTLGPLVAWGVLVIAAWRNGLAHRADWKLGAAPLTGVVERHVSVGTVAALAIGLVAARWSPRWAARARWSHLLLGAVVLSALWGSMLGLTRGPDGLQRGLTNRHDYAAVVPAVDEMGVRTFVDTFTNEEVLRRYPIHVQGHPIGAALLFVGIDRVGLGGPLARALVVIAVGSTTAAAVLTAVREVAGEDRARRALPFLVLTPAAVWAVASGDAIFAAVGAWGVALLVAATADAIPARRRVALALSAGFVGGVGMLLSYGLLPVYLVAAAVVVARRRWSVIGWAVLGGALVLLGAAVAGFWWFDGLAATHLRYLSGIARSRPRATFTFLGNPAAFAVAVGPATAVAVGRVRDRGLWLLAGGALAAVVVADASGLSKGEVERIWLPFTPWVLVLAAGLPALARRRPTPSASAWPPLASALLVAQVAVAVAVESLVKTPW